MACGKKRLTPHYAPTHAFWLSQIEIWLTIFTRSMPRALSGNRAWPGKQALISRIMESIANYSQLPARPFQWTYAGKPLAA